MFLKNVTLVAAGTVLAQAITIASTPIITRLYGPEAFGVLGLFTAIIAIITPLSAFSYPIAIVLPRDDSEAIGIAKLSLLIAAITSACVFLIILIWDDWILGTFKVAQLNGYVYLIPLAMFFSALLAVASQWIIRKKLYVLKSKVAVGHSIILNSLKAIIGAVYPLAGVLIGAATFNSILHSSMIFISLHKKTGSIFFNNTTTDYSYINLLSRYKDFFIYRTPQVFLNASSQSIPVLMLTSFFGASAAGFYSLAKLALAAPAALLGEAVSSVFYPKFNETYRDSAGALELFIKATLFLALIGIIPFSIVFIFGPDFFSFVFGDAWEVAGGYAQWLSIWLYFGFINRPSVAAIPVLAMQRFFLIYEVVSVTLRVITISVGYYIYNDPLTSIAFFSIIGAVLNSFLIGYVFLSIVKNRR